MTEQKSKLATYLQKGVEVPPGTEYDQTVFTEPLDIVHSCELDKSKPLPWRAALHVTKQGIVPEKSAVGAIRGEIGAAWAEGIFVESRSDDFSVLIADAGRYALKKAHIAMPTNSDGKKVCDFAGLGSAVAAFNGARVDIEDSEIVTEGVAKCAVYADNAADVVVKNCRIEVRGGKLYDGYINSADFNYMVASPWVLGMTGNARGTNIMGDKTSMAVVDSDVKARNWGVLSTDNGEGNILAVIDSTLTVTGGEKDKDNPYHKTFGSGYGTYILGCDEDFRGVTIYAGTYVGIARDGNAVYRSSKGPVRVLSARDGSVLYEGDGKGNISRLHSDAFGIMAHGNAELTLTDGTELTTENAAFLLKSGGVHIRVEDGAKITPKDGVLLQIIDDDDMTVGVNWHGTQGLQFNTEFHEKAGWPSENGQVTSMMPPPDPSDMPPPPPLPEGEEPPEPPRFDVSFNVKDAELTGNIWNGSGYYGQKAKELVVALEAGAVLTGTVSAAETIHVDENGKQNTHFTSDEYWYLGHVANRPYCHGENTVEVVLEPGSVWNVKGEGILTALTVKEGAVFNGLVVLDGVEFLPEAGRTYTGELIVTELQEEGNMQRYDALLSPLRVGDIVLKNRMMSSASTPHFLQGRELWPTEKIIGHFTNRAKSGAAAVTINHLHVDMMPMPGRTIDDPPAHFNMYELDDATCQNYMCQLIDDVHCYGTKVIGYIMNPVGKMLGGDTPPVPMEPPKTPSPDEPRSALDDGPPGVDADTLTREEMDAFIADYVQQAKDLKALGFDIVSIYACYRNQPMSRLFSPLTNHRQDEYGGSLENRARFTVELLTALRKALGKGYPIELVFSVSEPEGGYSAEDCIEFAKLCDGLVDILHLRAGEMDPQHPLGFTSSEDAPEPYLEEMGKVTKAVHAAGLSMAVGVSSGMFDIGNADAAVREGKADLVYMARSWISNPNYGELVYEGRGEDIVPCVRCNKCHVPSGREMFRTMCTVNPLIGLEDRLDKMYPASVPSRKVAVVGGGPAGMEFAKIARQRGHSVTLYEASDALGGMVRHADYASFKWPLRRFKDYLIGQMDKLGVDVRLNTRATKEMLLAEGYDMVAVAVGAHPIAPPFPGKDLPNVYYGMTCYGQEDKLGDTVAVIGGGEIGVETALWLGEIGKKTIVLEMLPELILDAPHAHYKNMVRNYWLKQPLFESLTNVRCTAIEPDGVKYIGPDGEEKKVFSDSVLLCAGAASNTDIAEELIGSAPQMAFIGDCNKFGNVQKAVREGWAAAMNIR